MPREFLLFRLSGPLASWGEIAVGERRSSWPRPSKSAVLGLVAAALGYDRHDAGAHASLNDGLNFAVRVDTPVRSAGNGVATDDNLKPLRDFHTAEFPPQILVKEADKSLPRAATRADHLRAIKFCRDRRINPVLSERWYWTNMTATAALWRKDGEAAAPTPAEIERALREPVFALYLGRKSCPPSRPLFPEIISAEDLSAAFAAYDTRDAIRIAQAIPQNGKTVRDAVFCALTVSAGRDIWADLEATAESERKETYSRRDAIRDRRSWTFSDRTEARIDAGGSDVSVAG